MPAGLFGCPSTPGGGYALRGLRRELARREQTYRKDVPPLSVAGQTVILVDDGAAIGATMLAAVRSLHAREAVKVIAALPVASAEAVDRLQREGAESDAGGFVDLRH